jgi:Tfp pilus assembly protein PilV
MTSLPQSAVKRQTGAVALLTTIIISILLTIIVTGLIALMVSELRQSNDAEQSVRAFYAAQSGVEDGLNKVISDLAAGTFNDRDCSGLPSAYQNLNLDTAAPGQVGWTCQQISYSGSPTGSLPARDKAVQVDIGPLTTANSLVLQWDVTPPPFAGGPLSFFNAPASFPNSSAWPYAAAIELGLIDYPSGSFSASTPGQINLRNALAVPRTAGTFAYSFASIKPAAASAGILPMTGKCDPAAGSYHCWLVVNGLPSGGGRSLILRLRSRYVGTDYKVSFWSGSCTTFSASGSGNCGANVPVPDGTATIDITAKAGDVYRRVQYKVPYQNNAATGLDYVIFSDQDICKNFDILNGAIDTTQPVGCPYN